LERASTGDHDVRHIGLKVGNLDASVRFYTAVLAPLGYVLCSRDETARASGQGRAGALALSAQGTSRRGSISRSAPDHAAIAKFHAAGVKAAAATTALPARAPTTARPTSPRS